MQAVRRVPGLSTDAALTPFTPEYPALVIGAGGLGQFGIELLRLLSSGEVIVADVADDKLEMAARTTPSPAAKRGAWRRSAESPAAGRGGRRDFVGADATLALAFRATRRLGRVVQVRLDGGVAKLTALQSWQPEVSYWGNIQELREVLEIADDGRLTLTPREFETPERVNDVYHRLQKLAGRGKSGDHAVSAWPGAEDQFSAGSTAAGSTSSR